MTTKSLDNSAKRSGSGSITRHPAFPAVVALWFMVLLGFGGLLIPIALLERVAEVSRLASLLPAAAPPLGFTAKLVVAVALSVVGALLGFKIARRVTGAGSHEETEADLPATSRATFNVATDLPTEESAGRTDASSHPLRRRRALAIADLGPVEEISPEAEPQYNYASDYTPAPEYAPETPAAEVLPPEPGFQDWRRSEEVFEEAPEAVEPPVIEAVPYSIEMIPAAEPVIVPNEPESEPEPEPDPVIEAEFVPVSDPAPAARPSTPLDDLDITQLVERFADTVRRRREWLASAQQAQPAPIRPLAVEPEAVAPAPTPAPAPALPPQPEEEPTAKRPPFFDWLQHLNAEPRADIPAPGFSVPMDTAAFVKRLPVEEAGDERDAEVELEAELDDEDDVYGSLIEMKNPFAQPRSDFIRIEEDEADLELGIELAHEQEKAQERPDTADAEASLRAALAKLQQLSGNP